ncbi:MAG: HIT family protein [Spongiibacteraceae bacterium]|nr:HIT family protein [Spongiibacteraceae bacterium]
MSEDCIFCRIIAGQAPSERIYEDARVFAMLDIMPAAEGHLLIVPKRHCADIFDADPEDIAQIGRVSVTLAKALERTLGAEGLGVYQLNRAAAGQTVFHYHTHLIPRWAGAEPRLHGRERASGEALAALGARLREALTGIAH